MRNILKYQPARASLERRPKALSIIIAGGQPNFRKGLRRVIETQSDLRVVGEASDGTEAVNLVRKHAPRILLLDLAVPGLTALKVLHNVSASNVSSIVLAAEIETPDTRQALSLGARAVMRKDSPPELLLKGIRNVTAGERYMDRENMDNFLAGIGNGTSPSAGTLSGNHLHLIAGARILGLIPAYDSVVFSDYILNVDHVEDVSRLGLPEDGRAAQSWLRFLIRATRLDDAQRTWGWVVRHGYADGALTGEYIDFLIQQGHLDSAASVWAQHMGARADDYDNKSTYLFNGDVESDPAPSPFDWNVARIEGVEVTRDCITAASGKCSLRISFAGTQNLGVTAASQLVFVRPGIYRFHAFIRTEALTTDQGIRFRITDAEAPARLDEVFGQFTGSNPWLSVDHDFVVAPKTRLVRIEVVRQPSMQFDNKVGGTAWIDQLKVEPNAPGSCAE